MNNQFSHVRHGDAPRPSRSRGLFGSRGGGYVVAGLLVMVVDASVPAQIVDGRDDPTPTPRTPGFLRPITELRPVGGDIRPVGGGIRPVGGNLGPSGSDLRPVEVTSPLANDRSFDARQRPNTTAVGVTGFAVEPGWDDPPWPEAGDRSGGAGGSRRARGSSSSGGVALGGVASSGSVGQVLLPGRFSADRLPVAPAPAAAPAADAAGASRAGATRQASPGPVQPGPSQTPTTRVASSAAASAGPQGPADRDWFEVGDAKAQRPRQVGGDVRPDLRLAVRLTANGRQNDAVDVVRHVVYSQPEAFAATQGSVFESDPAMQLRIREAIEGYQDADRTRVSDADAAFMVAAFSASLGDLDAALKAIQSARALGENRVSGKALHRVLSRPQAQTQDPKPSPEVQP